MALNNKLPQLAQEYLVDENGTITFDDNLVSILSASSHFAEIWSENNDDRAIPVNVSRSADYMEQMHSIAHVLFDVFSPALPHFSSETIYEACRFGIALSLPIDDDTLENRSAHYTYLKGSTTEDFNDFTDDVNASTQAAGLSLEDDDTQTQRAVTYLSACAANDRRRNDETGSGRAFRHAWDEMERYMGGYFARYGTLT